MFDYEKYAQTSPTCFAEGGFPPQLLPAMDGASGTFLEVGAGDGIKLQALMQTGALSNFTRIMATDISQLRVARIAANVASVEAFQSDAEALQLPSDSVGFYYSDQVIEHVPSDDRMAREAFRVLAPGGRAFIGSVFKTKGAWYYYRANGRWVIDPSHVREYTDSAAYRRIFEGAGFQVRSIELDPVVTNASELLVRGFSRLKLLDVDKHPDLYRTQPWSSLRKVRLRVPRYFYIFASLQKPLNGSPA